MLDFFMGANTPNGFYSFYDELQIKTPTDFSRNHVRSYLIKGGAGTGKSSLMKKVVAEFKQNEPLLEEIHCSSDPDSLDGVILHNARISIVDATPPHVIEPTFPGGFETVINLCEYINEEKAAMCLKKTVLLQGENSACHVKCRKLMRAASILLDDNACFVEGLTDFSKIRDTAQKICKTYIGAAVNEPSKNMQYKRLLSAVTSSGIVVYENTINALCDTVIAVNDSFGVTARAFMAEVCAYVKDAGYQAYFCCCPLDPAHKIEHIIIEKLRLAFITKSHFHRFPNVNISKNIHFSRFTNMKILQTKKQSLSFNRKLAEELLSSAVDSLKEGKKIHDELERQYIGAVDFSLVDKKTSDILKKIHARYDTSLK